MRKATTARRPGVTGTPMCELLICVQNMGTSGTQAIDSHAPQIGDVICAQADGWPWGACELGQVVAGNVNGNHPFFRVVKLPNITVAQVSNLLSPEVDVNPQNPSPYLQYRGWYLNINAVGPNVTYLPLTTYWNDNTRAQPFLQSALTFAQLQPLITQRTPIAF